ncbi:MAG TPA: hypothetical protein VGL39_15840 [Jatrophihabitantaceae bacterium]
MLTSATLAHVGVSRSAARTEVLRGRWQQLARGVLLTRPDPPTRLDWAMVGLVVTGPESALSGWDAVRLLGLGPARPTTPRVLVLTTRGPTRNVGGAHIRRVRGPLNWRLTSVRDPGLPLGRVVAPSRAIVDTALDIRSLGTVRALVARAVQTQTCQLDELVAEFATARRRDSAPLMRTLTDLADGARSAAEAIALSRLRTAPIPPFELNVPIVQPSGRPIAVADVLWRELRAVLEIDSYEFHFFGAQWQATSRRHNRLTTAGLSLTHYAPSTIQHGTAWLEEVADWLRRRASELGVPFRTDGGVRRAADTPVPLILPARSR